MKSNLLLFALALACASCAGEPQSNPAPAAPVAVTAATSAADVPVADAPAAQPARAEDLPASGESQGGAGRPHLTGAAHAVPSPGLAHAIPSAGTAHAIPSPGAAPAASPAPSAPRRITAEELRPLLDARKAVLVDVRGASDWDFHRAAEAIHIPYDQLSARSAALPHEALLALYCT